ncbi:MAG: hypothetical protein ACTMHL_02295, partial [Janibacter sp.]
MAARSLSPVAAGAGASVLAAGADADPVSCVEVSSDWAGGSSFVDSSAAAGAADAGAPVSHDGAAFFAATELSAAAVGFSSAGASDAAGAAGPVSQEGAAFFSAALLSAAAGALVPVSHDGAAFLSADETSDDSPYGSSEAAGAAPVSQDGAAFFSAALLSSAAGAVA